MPDSLRTTIGQFSSAGGRAQARAINVRAVEPAADLPGAEHGNLYMLVEVTGSGGGHAALYRQVLNAAQTAFYEARGALPAALARAVSGAHSALVRANEALPEADWRAGITCAALQGRELMIAQAGPTLALVSHPKTVDQCPAIPGPSGPALGGGERPEVQLFETTVEPGSILLLAQSDWLDRVAPEALAVAAAAESVTLAGDYLGQLAGTAELSALMVGFGAVIPEVREDAPAALRLPGATADRQPAGDAGRGLAAGATRLVEGLRVFGGRAATPAPETPLEPAAEPAAALRDEEASRTAAEPRAVSREADRQPKRSLLPLILAVIVIPLIVAVIVLSMLWLRTRAAEEQFQQTLAGAVAAIADAEKLTDETLARARLRAAREFLDKARTLRPADAELARLQTRYSDSLNRVDHVTPLYSVVLLWEFKESNRRLERVVAGGDSLFVLDRGRSEIYRFVFGQLKESVTPAEKPVILRKGEQVGDLVVSDLLDIAWMEAVGNQRSRLLALDTNGGLVSFDVTYKTSRVPLAGRDQWGLPQLVATYGGNFYIVDTKVNMVWRYRPGDKGFENPPEKYFTANTAVDMASIQSIAIDGNIWLLMADSRLLKFFVGESKPFELRGLPDALSAATAVVAPVDGNQVYIADAGNGRIVEFDKEGKFLRQLRPSQGELREMRDVFLDEAGNKLYILTADALYKADLPKPAAAPAPTG
jgi:cell division protein FtsB